MILAILASAVIILTIIAFLQPFWWEQARTKDRLDFAQERESWRQERNELLNRIQAPELGVLPTQQTVPYVAPEDDQGYWDAVEEREQVNGGS
jgi:hypothetical protein